MIDSDVDVAAAIERLRQLDERLHPVIAAAGAVPLRRTAGGLRGLCSVIVSQQVSRASAEAIFARLLKAIDIDDPEAILAAPDSAFRMAGLSRPKQKTLLAIAGSVRSGELDLARVAAASPAAALDELLRVHGIGPWTAECYLLFSAGHPDIFPAGDLALQHAVMHALALEARPTQKALVGIAKAWAPHRSVAARLFWAYYREITRRDAAPVGA